MAGPGTLYRFRISVSDVDRNFYEEVDVRAAMHPSETSEYLLTRVLAYALNYADGIEFSPGLCTGDEPAILVPGPQGHGGRHALWIDIGSPSPRKLHKAAKAAEKVRVYTYKDPVLLVEAARGEDVHRAEEIEVFSFEAGFLRELGKLLERDNHWGLIHGEGELVLTSADQTLQTTIGCRRLA